MPTFPAWLAGQRITAGQLNAGLPVTIVKPSDQSLTSNVTLQNDNALTLPVVVNSTWDFECYLLYEGGTQGSSDLKYQWSAPAGSTLRYQLDGLSSGGVQLAGPGR